MKKYIEVKENAPEYGKRIAKILNDRNCNVTQAILAEKASISTGAMSNLIHGVNTPSIDVIQRIANYLNVSVDYLLGNTDIKPLNLELQAISKHTGLSEKSINKLSELNSQNNLNWTMDLLNYFIESENFEVLLFYLLQYATHKNQNIDYSYYTVNTKDIAFTKIQDTIAVISKELCATFEKVIEKTGDTRVYYSLLEHLYNTNKITKAERLVILDEFKKGNYACLEDDTFEKELKQRAKNKEVNI